jgi:uncharacterized protein (DUF58 family)
MKYRAKHRITFAGFVFTGVTVFVLVAAVNSQSNLLFWAFGLMLGGLILSGLLSWMMLRNLEVRRVAEESVVAGLPANVHYVLTNGKKRWPAFAVQVKEAQFSGELSTVPDGYCLHVGPGGMSTMMTQMVARRRGRLRLKSVEISCAFPFGFLAHAVYVDAPREILVYPRIGQLNSRLAMRYRETITSGTMTSSMRGGNDEFYGLREYRPGDSVRAIAWKRSARTGEVVVREMTANAPPQMMVVLNLRTWRDLPTALERQEKVEKAIELAASLLCYGSMENFAVGLLIAGLAGQEAASPQMGREARSRSLAKLATLNPDEIHAESPRMEPSRLARRAEWIVVTLTADDEVRGLVPPGASSTVMRLDDPDTDTWVHFVGSLGALRILRSTVGKDPPASATE